MTSSEKGRKVMRKTAVIALMSVFVLASGITSNASVLDKIILYIPNRIVDITDIMTMSAGFGPNVRLNIRATRVMQLGAGTETTAKIIKGYNRQYGAALERGSDAAFMCIATEDTERTDVTGSVKEYWYKSSGVPSLSDPIYSFYTGSRDYWDLGFDLGLGIVEFGFGLHPVEIADLVTGFFFIDLKGDDFTTEELE